MRPASTLRAALVGVLALVAALWRPSAHATSMNWPDTACQVPVPTLINPDAIARTRQRLDGGQPVVIVAFGSSSTQGAGASTPAFAYPAQLEILLRERAGALVNVINRGIGGETIAEMRRRLDRDVIALNPDLVIWQVGSNAVLRTMDPSTFTSILDQELTRLTQAGIEVVLMGLQKAPRIDAKPEAPVIAASLFDAAQRHRVALMPRHRIMEAWAASDDLPGDGLIADGLHMNDHGYRCLALLLAQSILWRSLPDH